MTITAQQYAKALYLACENKNKTELILVAERFFSILSNDGQVDNWFKIEKYFKQYWNERNDIMSAKVLTVGSVNQEIINLLSEKIKKLSNNAEVDLEFFEDRKIIGGYIIYFNDQILDLSFKNGLEKLSKSLSK